MTYIVLLLHKSFIYSTHIMLQSVKVISKNFITKLQKIMNLLLNFCCNFSLPVL